MNRQDLIATDSATFSGALASTNAIKTSIATSASPADYTTFNGTLAGGPYRLPRTVSVTSSASAGSYIITSPIVFTGTDANGTVITESLSLTATGGGETIVGTKGFATVTEIAVPAMHDTSGAFTFGVQDVIVGGCAELRFGKAGNVKVVTSKGNTDTILDIVANERIPLSVSKIFGDASTTVQDITVLFQ